LEGVDFADADLVFDDRPAPRCSSGRRAAGLYAAVLWSVMW